MSTLANPEARAECQDRIRRLTPDAQARWGRMNVHGMLCHLNDSFRLSLGERQASFATGFLQRTLVKWVALRAPFHWPQGVPTRPEIEQGHGGTPPGDWERDRAELIAILDRFASEVAPREHPIFGRLTTEEWLIWGYRHVDHHLRQFGA